MASFPSIFRNVGSNGLQSNAPNDHGCQQQQFQNLPNNGSGCSGQIPQNSNNHQLNFSGLSNPIIPQYRPDQVWACTSQTPTPIFIVPNIHPQYNNCPAQLAPQNQGMPFTMACPATVLYQQQQCYPCPVPMTCQPIAVNSKGSDTSSMNSSNCKCYNIGKSSQSVRFSDQSSSSNAGTRTQMETNHSCTNNTENNICTKMNCPESIHLQALISQLLSISGIVSCAVTRMLLKRIPESGVTETPEETVELAQRAIAQLTKDQLLHESRSSIQVNALLNLYLTVNPLPVLIPILTSVQLKNNVLKAQIEALINKRIMENQGFGAPAPENLDPLILGLKSNSELRQLLASLREKECEERVNINFAPYRSQRFIAESRLYNIQKKIEQVESELNKRRDNGCSSSSSNPQFSLTQTDHQMTMESRSHVKLLLKPHVGSPETTYEGVKSKPNADTLCE